MSSATGTPSTGTSSTGTSLRTSGPARADAARLPMSFTIEGEHLVISVEGEIDAANADALPAAVCAAVNGDKSVLIDISRVSFLDSSFLRAILLCTSGLEADGVEVRVRNPRSQARRLFETTGLTHMLDRHTEPVLVEFDDLTAHQRRLVNQHPLAHADCYRHGGLPVRWVASFACRPGCDGDQLFNAIREWAGFYGLPLRRRVVESATTD
jgi:anti-sigma B factor antagonist